ncbi:LL-diaminopimelate aminotransferase [candidate division KSB1 bacterium]|nr:LL-diaminopimelate aminotransferase [candidate division KSB1 bacterium]RQW10247.1 MAG: LL-diaminopimelate aminotransferase [candidate division KSB1 bacterium]
MATINSNYDKLGGGYLFPEIGRRVRQFQAEHPGVKLLKLGIGNTTEALTPAVIDGLLAGVERLAHVETYTGYADDSTGETEMKKALQLFYRRFNVSLDLAEIFVSDGAKPDSGNIQSIFGIENVVAVQDPAYPVYVDTNVIAGRSGAFDARTGQYQGIIYMPCTQENGFFPQPPEEKVDLIYLCSPNNPTGAVATKEQLKIWIDYARARQSVIIFDAAYSAFIKDATLPRSIYELDGAKECAIEISSFSKVAGFTGVRLGWAVVPQALVVEGAPAGKVNWLWARRQNTFFNGASNIVQAGGVAALSDAGQKECQGLVDYYMNNARVIREGLQNLDYICYGGVNAPYIWMKTPHGLSSWEFFDLLLHDAHVVGTPGVGFGPSGEGYFRLSAFGHAADIEQAVASIRDHLKRQ